MPTDDAEHGLQKLKANKWFNVATKVAIAIGNDTRTQSLIDFTGNDEAVLTVHTIDELKKMIRMVSVTASRVNSKTTSVGKDAPSKAEETINSIKDDINNDPTLAGIDVGNSSNSTAVDDWSGW